MPAASTSIWQEGLILPPVRLTDEVLRVLLANVRTPEIRRADLAAQIAANRLAERAARRARASRSSEAFDAVIAYAERRAREAIARLPDGRYEAAGEVELGRRPPDPGRGHRRRRPDRDRLRGHRAGGGRRT